MKKLHWTQNPKARRAKPKREKQYGNKLIGLRVPAELLTGLKRYGRQRKHGNVQETLLALAVKATGVKLGEGGEG